MTEGESSSQLHQAFPGQAHSQHEHISTPFVHFFSGLHLVLTADTARERPK